MKPNIQKIISGGQTGVDRAALDAAIQLNIPHGGYCPKNRTAEDGKIADQYQLIETPSEDYAERTEWNVRSADATLVFVNDAEPMGGTLLTIEFAKQYQKLYLIFDLSSDSESKLIDWLNQYSINVLNIAGPRASQSDDIYQRAFDFLLHIFKS